MILLSILDAIQKIEEFSTPFDNVEHFYESQLHFDAILMNFVVIGEAITKISKETKTQYKTIPWQKTKDFRNLVAHNYLGINPEEVWQIVKSNIPKLKNQILEILEIL